ncbi:ATP-binding cassette domain-containing protein [Brevibacterium aurantiacum]|uniref:ATP-binding cassette domain-containing protein n=1 Tax=Brevibacterium aurantiacum TaxID=273384 RepID=A0A556C3T5_BREAU|nr:ATP-binding cassette domain-containing protein [Brevibacterium aurantiacum]
MGKDAVATAADVLNTFGLRLHVPFEVSGGQRQSLAVARSAVAQTSIHLADEPTETLDGATVKKVFDVIAVLIDQQEQTVRLVVDDPAAAARVNRLATVATVEYDDLVPCF